MTGSPREFTPHGSRKIFTEASLGFLALLVSSLLPLATEASITVISTRDERDPATGARFVEYKKRVTLPKDPVKYSFYMTDTRFVLNTGAPQNIERFGVVQVIRGCVYTSRLDSNGHIDKQIEVYREHFGQQVPFQHKDWELDIDSTDPLYSSYAEAGRWALFKWNKNAADLTPETATYYAEAPPPHGSAFLTDLPSPAELRINKDDKEAQNVALEFKTCVFNIGDLPVAVTDPRALNIDISKALWCADWDHKFAWDFKQARMIRPKAIDPVCGVTGMTRKEASKK